MTPSTTAAVTTASLRAPPASSRCQIGRSCMPINTKANAFNTNTTVSQTAKIGTRMRAGICAPPRRAIVIAYATSVRMPDNPIASAAIQTPKVQANCTISAIGTSSQADAVNGRSAYAQATPAARLPNKVSRNTGA